MKRLLAVERYWMAFLVAVMLIMLLGWKSLSELQAQRRATRQLLDQQVRIVLTGERLRTRMERRARGFRGYLLTSDQRDYDRQEADYRTVLATVDTLQILLDTGVTSRALTSATRRIAIHDSTVRTLMRRAAGAVLPAGDLEEFRRTADALDSVQATINDMRRTAEQSFAERRAILERSERQSFLALALLSATGALMAGAAAWMARVAARRGLSAIRSNDLAHEELARRRSAESALAARTRDLERSNRDLEQFAYVASHDLQEPLRMVGSYTQLLARRYKGKLDGDADEFIGYAVDGVKRMQRLIKELLAYSRVGRVGPPPELVSADSVLERVLRDLDLRVKDANAVVTHDPLPEVWADAGQLGLVFQNLIVNALKFQSDRPPVIHVSSEVQGDSVEFAVRDNGVGIEPQHFERIFMIFQRLQRDENGEGTGLGLAICKRIVERYGGQMRVTSTPDVGSTFFFSLSRTAPASASHSSD